MDTFKRKSYPILYQYKEDMKETLKKLIKDEIIEHSTTLYINSIVTVKKRDGYIRICLDA